MGNMRKRPDLKRPKQPLRLNLFSTEMKKVKKNKAIRLSGKRAITCFRAKKNVLERSRGFHLFRNINSLDFLQKRKKYSSQKFLFSWLLGYDSIMKMKLLQNLFSWNLALPNQRDSLFIFALFKLHFYEQMITSVC